MGSRKKKKKRKVRKVKKDLEIKMAKRISYLPKDAHITIGKGKEKMSEILIDFAEPLFEFTENEDAVYHLAMIAWNASIMPENQRDKIINEAVMFIPKDDSQFRADLKTVLKSLIQRKLELYPNNKRVMVGYEFTESGNKRILNVLSTLNS